MDELERQFRSVGEVGKGSAFRGAPFWSWNDKLDTEELRRQIRAMQRGGLGGHFMHARIGLETPYLSEEWMKCIEACVDESRKMNMHAWLYDEDKWPSGFAGGLVSGRGGEYNRKSLRNREVYIHWDVREFVPADGSLRYYLGVKKGRTIIDPVDVTGIALNMSEHRGKTVFEFYAERDGYVDLLNPKVVEAFIESTYERYYERFGKEFGWERTIPGIFTDEPNYGRMPWTDELPRVFKERRGYNLLDHLPSIFYEVCINGRDWRKVRHDYFRTATEMFVEAFTKRIYEWCEVHGLALTGHFLAEDNLVSQISVIGAAMPHYEFMQIPGIDHLCRRLGSTMLVKQVSSVAHQFGGRRVLSEMFGCSGWNMSFEDQRWIAEWQFALGVDLVCQHLVLYSLRGCRKRDFPPSFNDHQPWWDYFHLVNDRFARITYMLTRGKHVASLLLLHPISSAWCVYHPQHTEEAMRISNAFEQLSKWLLELHIDYDYGDEMIMRRHASVKDGMLFVGSCSYPLVIVPPSLTMFSETFRLLEEFARSGGSIIAVEPLPTMIDGEECDDVTKFLKRNAKVVAHQKEKLKRALERVARRSISLCSNGDEIPSLIYQERQLEDGRRVFFITNTSREEAVDATVKVSGVGQLQLWDADTGEVKAQPCAVEDECVVTKLRFAPTQSHLLVLDPKRQPKVGEPKLDYETVHIVELGEKFKLKVHDPNALTLDFCDYQIDGGEWQLNQPVIRLNRLLTSTGEPCKLIVRYKFEVEQLPPSDKPLWLAIETPHLQRIFVNGEHISSQDEGFYLDRAFRMLNITGRVKLGENVIECQWDYKPPMEVESCYIVGTFGVRCDESLTKFVIASLPDGEVEATDLVQIGLPFYAGRVTLSKQFELPSLRSVNAAKALLELDQLNAIVADVNVNGTKCGTLVWRPLQLDITRAVRRGMNEISITLINSLRNLLGPHHHPAGELFMVGPWSFGDGEFVERYCFVPFGISGARIRLVR
ncbi:MAG: hypothetical protein GDYSWBUE_000808 [Candidatus Fervidibacterota bacterium]